MKRKTARCIAIHKGARCHRTAALVRMGDLFVCTGHGLFHIAIIDDWLRPATRRMLAFSRWRTVAQAQALVDAERSR